MQPLDTLERYRSLKRAARERCGKLSTNCLLTGPALEELANQGALYYEEYPQGFVLFSDEGSYYRAFYWLSDAEPVPDMRRDKLVSIEELDNEDGRRSEYLKGFFAKLEAAGWTKIARNVYVERLLEGSEDFIRAEFEAGCARVAEQGLALVPCRKEHEQSVIELWKNYLHETDVPAEHLGFMDDETQRVACIVDGDIVCAVNWWQLKGGRCETRHIVTDPRYYKRGLAYVLQLAAMSDAVKEGCRSVFTYIDEVNYRSLALYEKVGIIPNGRVTYQYGLKGECDG